MKRVIFCLCMIFASTQVSAQNEMKIEGSCRGQYEENVISFKYYSTFEGCGNKSQAKITFTPKQNAKLIGTRTIENDLDTYNFDIKRNGQNKTVYWLVFADSTGNTEATFKYWDSTGAIKSVILQCQVYDYEYEQC